MKSTTCEEGNENRGTASEFITERRYLKNVTSKTLTWYEQSFKAFDSALDSEAAIKRRIMELRTRGSVGSLCQHLAPMHQGLSEMAGFRWRRGNERSAQCQNGLKTRNGITLRQQPKQKAGTVSIVDRPLPWQTKRSTTIPAAARGAITS